MAKILVIDDSQDLLELFSILLKWKGFHTETVSSKDRAKIILSEFSPDLIILDVKLNGEDGRELCKDLKEKYNKAIPIILTSADPNLLKEYGGCNADAVREKPFDVKKVFEEIKTLLNKYQSTQSNH